MYSAQKPEYEFINEMQKQQIAFKSFLSNLKKTPNKYFQPDINPQQTKYPYNQSSLRDSNPKKIIPNNLYKNKTKIQTIQKIKRSEEAPLVNFRVIQPKPIQKSRYRDLFELKSTQNTFQISKFSNTTQNLNSIMMSKLTKDISPQKQKLSSLQKKDQNSKSLYVNSTTNNNDKRKKSKKMENKVFDHFKMQRIPTISWVPDSKSFLTKLYEQKKQTDKKSMPFFLSQLLSMDVQSTIQFLKLRNQNLCEGKIICNFFNQLFQLNRIKNLKQPLIKKYNNCIYYGQKPNFDMSHSGAIIYFNGNAYFGSLKNFQKHGLGIQFVKQKNLPNDAFRIDFSQQNAESYVVYRGDFLKNSKTGQFLINASNYVYQGSLLKSFFEGSGTLISQISTFKGFWSMSKKLSGHQQFKNQSMSFEGEYLDQKFHGYGKLKKADQFYEGEFQIGEKHGKGILVTQNYIFEGTFQKNKKHGKGIYFDKAQYRQHKLASDKQNFDFGQCIYDVEFRADKMIKKFEIPKQQQFQDQIEDLQSLKDEKSVYSTLTVDFANVRPSKLLSSTCKQQTPQKQSNIISNTSRSQKYTQVLSVIPSEPEEQYLFGNKVKTYLLGNKTHHLPNRIKKGYF